jgi:ribosome biogenesis GTPase
LSEGACLEGLVVRSQSGFYTVRHGDQDRTCTLPGRFKQGRRLVKNPVVIGDHVETRDLGSGEGVIEHILPRRNELARAAAGGTGLKHVLAANLDFVLLAMSLHEPPLNMARLDRYLLAAEQSEIPPLILITKLDLGTMEEAEDAAQTYRKIGYPVILTSSKSGQGLELLRDRLVGHVSAIVGPSGVGKSSVLNALQPGLGLKFAAISSATGKGMHTTTVAELLPLDGGGYLADTPGLRELAPWNLHAEELPLLFPEMSPYLDDCRFARCTHLREPGCAVRQAVEAGEIDPRRYRSYVKIRTEEIEPTHGSR